MYRFYKLILICLLFFLPFMEVLAKSRNFYWVDPATTYRNYIQLDTYELFIERTPGQWVNEGKVKLDPKIHNDIPPSFDTQYFILEGGKKIRFTLKGTGQVYEYEPAQRTFKRIDRTFYRGYNFDAVQFMRQGKLYSFGGYGFWHFSNVLTYYDELRAEWEILRPNNIGPTSIDSKGFSGYAQKLDVFYSGASAITVPLEKFKSKLGEDFFVFDFKTKSWTFLGKINSLLDQSTNWDVFWTGTYFLKWENDQLFIIDPTNNEVLLYQNNEKFFTTNGQYFVKGDTVYNYWNDKGNIDYFSVKEILNKATYVGPFYSRETPLLHYLLIFCIICSAAGSFWIYKRKIGNARAGYFDSLEEKLLLALMKRHTKGGLSSQQVNDSLLLHTKSFDNQRRVRVNVINKINQKMTHHYKISEAIVRLASAEDKRQSIYKLSPEAYQRLKEYFK